MPTSAEEDGTPSNDVIAHLRVAIDEEPIAMSEKRLFDCRDIT